MLEKARKDHGTNDLAEFSMYRFMRTVQAKNAACVAPAVAFAAGICTYVNKTYKVDMHFGVQAFDKARIHWFLDFESVDKAMAMNRAMLQDHEYQQMLDKAQTLWVEGSMRDALVNLPV